MLESKLVSLLHHYGPTHTSKICRILNNKHIPNCSRCRFYANPRKRRKYHIYDPDCKNRLPRVTADLKKLVDCGILVSKRTRITDVRQPRLYDMTTVYEIKNYDVFDTPLSTNPILSDFIIKETN